MIAPHRASYADPIAVRQGQALHVTERVEVWDGHTWVWASADDGRSGWVPDTLIQRDGASAVARYDYSAIELSCADGARLEVGIATHGWAWCTDAHGQNGWVPQRNLAPLSH